jgi:hypothetical protein
MMAIRFAPVQTVPASKKPEDGKNAKNTSQDENETKDQTGDAGIS